MTRIIIFGDLHANWEALLALQQAEPRPDTVFCLGDLVGYGPDPKRCLDAVRAGVSYVIAGTHDRAVASILPTNGLDGLLSATWNYTRQVLPVADKDYLNSLAEPGQTITVGDTRFYLTRFNPDNPDTETMMLITMPQTQLRRQFGHVEADIVLVGGSHIPAMRQIDGKVIVCPGSLGLPRYGVADPTFVAWEDGRLQIHHLHYHPHETAQKLSLLPLGPEYTLHLQSILMSGKPD